MKGIEKGRAQQDRQFETDRKAQSRQFLNDRIKDWPPEEAAKARAEWELRQKEDAVWWEQTKAFEGDAQPCKPLSTLDSHP